MRTTREHQGKLYQLTNEGLVVGDKVYPISWGRTKNGIYQHESFEFLPCCCGFPDEPHTILDLHHSDDKGYEVRTDRGYGPKEIYFKVIEVKDVESNLNH